MIDFKIEVSKCTKCGQCVRDCPIRIIQIDESIPYIKNENEKKCIRCQHCLAVCPTGALSILGVDPDDCVDIKESANVEQAEALIRSRRTVRQFRQKNVASEKLDQLIKTAANAPTGKNARLVQLHVIDDLDQMAIFKEKVISHLEKMGEEGKLTGGNEFFVHMSRAFRMGNDIIFRGAPHLVVATLPEDCPCPDADGIIVLSYMDIMAGAMGLGAVWLGFLMHIFMIAPELKELFNIPAGHRVAYAMLLGEPSVKYHRGVMRDDIAVNKVRFS